MPSLKRRGSTKVYKTPSKRARSRAFSRTKSKYAGTKRMIKKVLLNQSETKFTSYAYAVGGINHNSGALIDLWTNNASSLFPTVGDSENNRDGNEIVGRGFMIRGMFNVPYDRRDVRIDMYYVQHNTNMGNPLTDLFHNVTGNKMLDPVNKKRWDNVKKLGSLRVKATDAGMHSTGSWLVDKVITKTIMFKRWIPMNKKLKFYADSASNVTNLPEMGRILFFAYDTLSSTGADTVIHSGSVNATFYYKDP